MLNATTNDDIIGNIKTVTVDHFLKGRQVRIMAAPFMAACGEPAARVKLWNPETKTVSGANWFFCLSDME